MQPLIKLTDSKNDRPTWFNPEYFFFMETGVRTKDAQVYTVIHTRSQTKAKIFVKETPDDITGKAPALTSIVLTRTNDQGLVWLHPGVIISIETFTKEGQTNSIVFTTSTSQPKFFVIETPELINEQIGKFKK